MAGRVLVELHRILARDRRAGHVDLFLRRAGYRRTIQATSWRTRRTEGKPVTMTLLYRRADGPSVTLTLRLIEADFMPAVKSTGRRYAKNL